MIKKEEMMSVFEEYIAKNYIKRFIKVKNLKFGDLEEKIIGDYKIIQSNLIISENEKVSIKYHSVYPRTKLENIFDVLLAGSISEIAIKKSEFKSFIQDGDINPLIEALK